MLHFLFLCETGSGTTALCLCASLSTLTPQSLSTLTFEPRASISHSQCSECVSVCVPDCSLVHTIISFIETRHIVCWVAERNISSLRFDFNLISPKHECEINIKAANHLFNTKVWYCVTSIY